MDLSEEGINPVLDILKNSKVKISDIRVNRHHNKDDKNFETRLTFRVYTRNKNEIKKIVVNILKIPYVKNVDVE
jgi:putative Mg2+ transporter-C (MgtC) family protein